VAVQTAIYSELKQVLAAAPRNHVTMLTTAYGKPSTVDRSGLTRDAIRGAGLLTDCKPHGHDNPLGWYSKNNGRRRQIPSQEQRPNIGLRLISPLWLRRISDTAAMADLAEKWWTRLGPTRRVWWDSPRPRIVAHQRAPIARKKELDRYHYLRKASQSG
jgi:hypothetical protein